MRAPLQRLLSSVVLFAWVTPSAGALAVCLHLAVDHHGLGGSGHHGADHAELLQAATHGHHHEAGTAPGHQHDVRIDGLATVVRSGPLLAGVLPAPASPAVPPSKRSIRDGSLRRAPPDPLFAAHCSLLL